MLSLEEMKLSHRIALIVVIVLVVLFALALFGYFTGAWDKADAETLPSRMTTKWDARLVELEIEGLDDAYRENVTHLFRIWMRDDTGQPHRLIVGMNQSRKAYAATRDKIEAHKRDIEQEKVR